MAVSGVYWTLLGLVLLGGCAPFAPTVRNPIEPLSSPMPSQYTSLPEAQETPVSALATQQTPYWWTNFQSPDLNRLESAALDKNFDILTAYARLRQSEATAKKAGASLLPSLSLDSSATHKRQSVKNDTSSPRNETTTDTLSLGLAASYEVDLWGRVASGQEAELLRLKAAEDDIRTAFMTVSASVADTWASILGTQAELSILERQISINRDLVLLQLERFANALSTSLDVLQQRELLVASEAERPQLQQSLAILRTQLEVLLGQLPASHALFNETSSLPSLPPLPDTGLPVQLLEFRPDIRAAWARLQASEWDVSQARANRLPTLRLTASSAFSAPESSVLFANWITSLAASLTMPLFDGGSLKAEEERIRAISDERLQAYVKTVAQAVQEVQDALSTEQGERLRLARMEEQLLLASAARNEARNSYLGGVDTFLRYITQLKNVQDLERRVARQRMGVIRARIGLYRALGDVRAL